MDTLLKHLLDITGHRDHELIETAILSAISQIAGIKNARILHINVKQEKSTLIPVAWLNDGLVGRADVFANATEEPIEHYPVLMHCIQHHFRTQEKKSSNLYTLWVPIWSDDKVIACFEIMHHRQFSRKLLDLIEGMLGVYRNFISLLEYSETDSLTGLLNRKTFEKHFTKARLASTPLHDIPNGTQERRHESDKPEELLDQWLAVVDIDLFKRINDNFGHLYGDEVLILLAQLMKASFRSHDRIFRFGGEEFVILINSVTLTNVKHIVDRFRKTVESHRFPQVGTITVSIGFTSFHPEDSPVEVLGHADHALYYAKNHGRNQICHYEQLLAEGVLAPINNLTIAPIEFF